MMTFVATVVMKMLSDKLKDTNLTTETLIMALEQHRAKIYKDRIIVNEATKIMNYTYQKFKIKVPIEIEYTAPEGLWDIINNVGGEWVSNNVDTKTSGN